MTVREFRANLKTQLDKAAAGKTVTIARGGVVFELKKVAD